MKQILNLKSALLALATLALTFAGGATPTFADDEDWERLGAVELSQYGDAPEHIFNMPTGREYQRISFRARENNVHCDEIRVSYLNGGNQDIDHERFPVDERRAFDLYGTDRHIRHIHLDCRPGGNNSHARLVIYGR